MLKKVENGENVMSSAKEWFEIRLWYSNRPNPDDLFNFKKQKMLDVLDKNKIGYFLVLDEPDFVLLRIEGTRELAENVKTSMETSSSELFSHATFETWSPERDADTRISESRTRGRLPEMEGEWKFIGKDQTGKWQVAPEDKAKMQFAFATFMSRVCGQFTRAYLKEMPSRVEDRWLMSVFVHLMLDSISTWGEEEKQLREFPAI